MQNRVRSRHESLNGRFKNWEILKVLYRHDLMEHGNVFRAIAVITQLGINAGEKLFEVDIRSSFYVGTCGLCTEV